MSKQPSVNQLRIVVTSLLMSTELTQVPAESKQLRHRYRRSSHYILFPRHPCSRFPAVLRRLDYCLPVGFDRLKETATAQWSFIIINYAANTLLNRLLATMILDFLRYDKLRTAKKTATTKN